MKLKEELYTVSSRLQDGENIVFGIVWNAGHFIYQAHFPEMPVTPGVCIVQTARELLEECVGRPLEVETIKNAKFLSIISPADTPEVVYVLSKINVTENAVSMQAIVKKEETVFAKLSLVCRYLD